MIYSSTCIQSVEKHFSSQFFTDIDFGNVEKHYCKLLLMNSQQGSYHTENTLQIFEVIFKVKHAENISSDDKMRNTQDQWTQRHILRANKVQ